MSSLQSRSLGTAASSAAGADGLKIWSCTNCRRRKVRCDRRHPCIHCTRNNAECTFPISGRLPRRGLKTTSTIIQPTQKKHVELLGRLRTLEAMVSELGSQVESVVTDNSSSISTSEGHTASEETYSDDQVVSGQMENQDHSKVDDEAQIEPSQYTSISEQSVASNELGEVVFENNGDLTVGDRFWSIFCNEVEQIFEAVRGSGHHDFDTSSSSPDKSSNERSHIGYYNFLLQQASAAEKNEATHPLPSQMLFIWQNFVDTVAPFINILHVPSMTRLIRELKGKYDSHGPGIEALVLSISFAAISSLDEEEVILNFNIEKDQLMSRYRSGMEQAFGRAELLHSTDLVVVQALTIYVYVLQCSHEMNTAWALSGVLQKIAVRLRLHQDGSRFSNLTPFEVQMRRRLWWQICLIDSQSGMANATAFLISEKMFSAKIPVHIDDVDINPGTRILPSNKEERNDMTILLIRCEIWRLSRQLQSIIAHSGSSPSSFDEAKDLLQQSKKRIEATYINYLRLDEPLDSFVMKMTQLFFAKIELNFSLCTVSSHLESNNHREKIFKNSLSIISHAYSLQNSPEWRPFRWHISNNSSPWQAVRTILSQLCAYPWVPEFEHAWLCVKKSFYNFPRGDPLYQPTLKLMIKAEQHRARELNCRRTNFMINQPESSASDSSVILQAAMAGSEETLRSEAFQSDGITNEIMRELELFTTMYSTTGDKNLPASTLVTSTQTISLNREPLQLTEEMDLSTISSLTDISIQPIMNAHVPSWETQEPSVLDEHFNLDTLGNAISASTDPKPWDVFDTQVAYWDLDMTGF